MILSPLPVASLQSVFQFFERGGFFMVLLLACSVVSVAVIVLRALALRRDLVVPPVIEREIEDIHPGDVAGAATRLGRLVENDTSALGRIVQVGLRHLSWPKSENIEAVQTRAQHEIVRLESGLFVLEVIVGIAPLLGLLGAVSGLVTVFAAFGADVQAQDPHGIAKGISEALSTTIVGLAIAIPSLIAYSYFSRKVETMAAEMESITADLLAKCYSEKSRTGDASRRISPEPAPEREASEYAPAPRKEIPRPPIAMRPPQEEGTL
jgi:biopolymer transport protein ExbB